MLIKDPNRKKEQYMKTRSALTDKSVKLMRYFQLAVILFISLYFFLIPSFLLIRHLREPSLVDGSMPRFIYRWHKTLSRRYEDWAIQRIQSGKAVDLSTDDISGTEWPLFGSVFYLWATENMQTAWQQDNTLYHTEPKVYAKGAIEAAAALVTDPGHAGWVKKHWGDDYLKEQNLFYRMLLINAMMSYQKLLDDTKYQQLLTEQVNSLAKELDESPYGLLDDYPGQCYPVDILPAIAAIQHADQLLGTDHSQMIARAIRGFQSERLDVMTGLPAYNVNSRTGESAGCARGVGMSFMLIWAPQTWPDTARSWYDKYEELFWQQGRFLSGFREFPNTLSGKEWLFEVDAGPVLAGYGVAASAFGIGAARANGHLEHAYPLSAEALVGAWPLPDGTLLFPRLLSNLADAPYLGEAGFLFSLSRTPISPVQNPAPRKVPLIVYIGIALMIIIGSFYFVRAIRRIKLLRKKEQAPVPAANIQLTIWALLCVATVIVFLKASAVMAFLLLYATCIFPYSRPAKKAPAVKEQAAAAKE